MRRRTVTLQDRAHAPMRRGAPLGRGGAATTCVVTVSRNHGITETYCLKEFSGDATRETLLRELSVLSKLKHPAIAMLHDYVPAGTLLDDGTPLPHPGLLFELVEGVTLRELLSYVPLHRLSHDLVIEIALALADACAFAHTFVVHRDISASNVMLSCSGAVKLLDFGIAAVIRLPGEPRTKTICGKPGYMSPEQASGVRPVDGRSDLFTLGVLIYELLCGVRPFDGHTDSETMYRAERGIYVGLAERAPETPPALIAIVDRLLQNDPEARFESARALFDALDVIAPARATRYSLGRIATEIRANLRPTTQVHASNESPTVRAPQHQRAPETSEPTPEPLAARRRHRWPLLALGSSVLTAAAIIASLAFEKPRADDTRVPEPSPSQAAAVQPPAVNEPSLQEPATTQPSVASTPSGSPSPETPASDEDGRKPPEAAGKAQQASSRPATLVLGVRPSVSQLWVDGRFVGWSPQTIKLSPGAHLIGAGDGHPEVTQPIELRSGERRSLVVRR